jgi:hypothetical protein
VLPNPSFHHGSARRVRSVYGASRSHPVATGGKSEDPGNGRIKPKPLPPVATSCRGTLMVRRGSTVRVRQRAYLELGSRCKRRLFCCRDGHCGPPPWQGGDRRNGRGREARRVAGNHNVCRASGHAAETGDRFWGQITGARSRTGSHARAIWPVTEGEAEPSFALRLGREDGCAGHAAHARWAVAVRWRLVYGSAI